MWRIHLHTAWLAILLIAAVTVPAPVVAAPPLQAEPTSPDAPMTTPDTLVTGSPINYHIAAPKLFWSTGADVCPPKSADDAAPEQPDSQFEHIKRISIYGSTIRTLYSHNAFCPNTSTIFSNVVADDEYIYWTNDSGLLRLSTSANDGDVPEVFNPTVKGKAELAIDGDFVFALTINSSSVGAVWIVDKSNGAQTLLVANTGSNPRALSVSFTFILGSGQNYYVYWLQGTFLRRYDLNTGQLDSLASGIIAYYAEGARIKCSPLCFTTDLIYMSTNSSVLTYNNVGGAIKTIYNDNDPNDKVYSIVTDSSNVFFLQQHFVPCSSEPCIGGALTDFVIRHIRGFSDSGDFLATSAPDFFVDRYRRIKAHGDYIFWQDGSTIKRLPKNATALPLTNLTVTGMQVNQAVQRPDNSVRLIQNKRTFVRVFVKSEGPAVSGVTARLQGKIGATSLGHLLPVNPAGTNITVQPTPQRANIDDSFLFELPWDWTTQGPLTLVAQVNPYHAPPQASYASNNLTSGPFTFSASPRLQVQFVAWGYVLNDTIYYPRIGKDIVQTYSWIRRAYPLAGTPGFSTDPSPGFRPGLWFVGDDSLGARVARTHASCKDMKDKSLCASAYTNQQMNAMRSENNIGAGVLFYGFISDQGGIFPRGQACCGSNVSTGPAGPTSGWDTDGSYADWYAGHEVGHTLGRGHPDSGNTTQNGCATYDPGSGTDTGFPWPFAQIGENDNTEGFDAGDTEFGIARAVYPGTTWHDVMSYCINQWVSDYTYNAFYDFMTAAQAQDAQSAQPAVTRVNGDFLSVYGLIFTDSNTAAFTRLRRLSSVATIPPMPAGGHVIQLRDASKKVLASYAFKPDAPSDADPTLRSFGHIVDFVPGTTQVRILRSSDQKVLATAAVSANAPVVSNVTLKNAPNPVAGTVTLTWKAQDADGDALTYDVFYSRDNGGTLQPLSTNVEVKSLTFDTNRLGGGTAILRVVATDGVQTGQADSAPFTMAKKKPQPEIFTPYDGLHIHYGQLVNFSGAAEDFQDGSVAEGSLVWSNQYGQLGTGSLLSTASLPVGTNQITLAATNSDGLSATASITVVVDDDLNLNGPTLTAGPAQFGWNFPKNPSGTASQTLYIGNAGSGDLDWTATTNAGWLSLSASSGTAPSSVTLTADPAGLANGAAQNKRLVITGASQTLTIPVSISIDASYASPAGYVPNKAPVAKDDSASTQVATAVTIDVLANDSDPDGNSLTVILVNKPAHGSVKQVFGGLRYTPNSGFIGTDSFTYSVGDGKGLADGAKVTVDVHDQRVYLPFTQK